MSLINNFDVELNASININQGSVSDGRARSSGHFIANMGSFMLRCIPFFILSLFGGPTPPRGGKS